MSNIYKGEFQDYEGNVVYPHTSADVVFATDGKTVQSKLNQLGEGLDGVTGRTDSPEVDNSNILATSKAVHTLKTNFQAGVDSIYDAVVAKGSTPASKSLGDVINGIEAIQSVTIIHEPAGTYNNGVRDIKEYRDDWADLTIDNFYGLIKHYYCSYGGQQPSATYTWTYDNTTGILKCVLSAGNDAYFKRETDIVIVK